MSEVYETGGSRSWLLLVGILLILGGSAAGIVIGASTGNASYALYCGVIALGSTWELARWLGWREPAPLSSPRFRLGALAAFVAGVLALRLLM